MANLLNLLSLSFAYDIFSHVFIFLVKGSFFKGQGTLNNILNKAER